MQTPKLGRILVFQMSKQINCCVQRWLEPQTTKKVSPFNLLSSPHHLLPNYPTSVPTHSFTFLLTLPNLLHLRNLLNLLNLINLLYLTYYPWCLNHQTFQLPKNGEILKPMDTTDVREFSHPQK